MPDRGVYLDLIPYDEAIRKRQTPYTPALSLMYALEAQLNRIAAKVWHREALGPDKNADEEESVDDQVEEGPVRLGLSYLPREKHAASSNKSSCLKLPEGGKALGGTMTKAMNAERRLRDRRRVPADSRDAHHWDRPHRSSRRRRGGEAARRSGGGPEECLTAS